MQEGTVQFECITITMGLYENNTVEPSIMSIYNMKEQQQQQSVKEDGKLRNNSGWIYDVQYTCRLYFTLGPGWD